MMYITRHEHFNAAHKVCNPKWSDEKNKEVFGPCSNANWHGHNYNLYVTVKGAINPDTGFVVNLKELSNIIKVEITDKVDHKNLNLDVDFMFGKLASTENLVLEFWEILAPLIADLEQGRVKLHSIKLYETPNNYIEYFGEE
jgi:6-pyruvoyltetrahydropterin/6-carboxytetrahydropterin synthase